MTDEPNREQEERYRAAVERLRTSVQRVVDNQSQIRARAGPIYELSRERSRIISEAWRAVGSPRRPRGPFRGISGTGRKLYRPPDRTTAEWQVWRAWLSERARPYRELGWEPRSRVKPQPGS
jgi:hypothetical protein